MRLIPSCMATQHPDNAAKPYWNFRAFVSTNAEVKECYLCFSDLGIDEYNWDWEGKFVDEAVVDRLLHKYFKYFKDQVLGKDKFLTFRIPNPRIEKQFRLARSFMVIATNSQYTQSLGFANPPIFETILPLTETAEEVIDLQEAFKTLTGISHKLLRMEDALKYLHIIPLFEQVEKIMSSASILEKYIHLHQKLFGFKPEYLRPYCARSDPALNSGLIPTVLSLKVALSSYHGLENRTGVKLYPMLGTGSLPFRGSLRPDNIEGALDEYQGVSTLTVQSAFRYDYPKVQVKKAIRRLKEELPKRKAEIIPPKYIEAIKKAIPFFENPYQNTIEDASGLINKISHQVARRRERMLHIGLFGYSRGFKGVSLPRAIPFTASLYSLGIPPELIGTGRGLKKAKETGIWEKAGPYYKHLKDDLMFAGHFLNRNNLSRLAKRKNYWQEVEKDIEFIESIMKIDLQPVDNIHLEHKAISDKIYDHIMEHKDISRLITYGGILRKSIG